MLDNPLSGGALREKHLEAQNLSRLEPPPLMEIILLLQALA